MQVYSVFIMKSAFLGVFRSKKYVTFERLYFLETGFGKRSKSQSFISLAPTSVCMVQSISVLFLSHNARQAILGN